MNLKIFKYPVLLIFLMSIASCGDIFEAELGKEAVVIFSPVNNLKTRTLAQTFWWSEIKGATAYNFQIVTPSFDSIESTILDSTTAATQYMLTLSPGLYQWRVKAENASSSTPFTTYDLTILSDSTLDLSQQIVLLNAPENGLITNNIVFLFEWDSLTYADNYRLEIASPDFNGTLVISPQYLSTPSYSHTFTDEGVYQWRIRAENDFSISPYTTYSFTIDTTRPNQPVLLNPSHNSVQQDTIINFSWSRVTESGTAIHDSLWVYSDSTLASAFLKLETKTTATNYSDSVGVGTWYWLVRSFDAAGNKSDKSTVFKFVVQ